MPETPDEAARLNAEILEALLHNTTGAVRNSDPPQLHEIISKGEDEFEAPVVSKVFQDAGVTSIYDLKTGERSFTSVNLLPVQIRKLNDSGERMFSISPPVGITPKVGSLRCMLHPDERKPEYDEWGLATCQKAHIPSPLQLELHMRHRHRIEWETIERERLRKEKDEEREWQKQIAQAATANREPVGVMVPASTAAEGEISVKKGPFGRPLKTT